ncbi:MAG: MMPL family transporter [Gemmataceae bacterium]|nr:MMPL family transporter [Gemmataceae bacterium]MCI0739468.1 MMPL family transporter [Gemmataceae bacterium]
MFRFLGRLTATYPKTLCVIWAALGAVLALIAPHWDARAHDDDVRFIPERFTSVRAYQLLEKAFPQDVFASQLIFAFERDEQPLLPADLHLVELSMKDLEKLRQDSPELKIGKIVSFQDGIVGCRLTSADQQCTLVQVSLGTPYLAVATMTAVEKAQAIVRQRLGASAHDGLRIYTTGAAGIGHDLIKTCGDSLEDTTLATVILVVAVLLLVYRAPLLALVPLATIAVSVWVSLHLLALMTLLPGVQLVNISRIFAIVILYGAGTDYCLFLIARYREELQAGHAVRKALGRALQGVGEALTASAGTVMVGLGLMVLAEFAKVRYAGPAIALSLGVALLACLTLTPALLRLLGPIVFWPRRAPVGQTFLSAGQQEKRLGRQECLPHVGLWDWISHKVAARPALVWSSAMLLLLPLVLLGLQVKPNYRATGELSTDSESLQGLAAIQRHFTAGEIGPVTILLASEKDWDSREGLLDINHLSRGFALLPNVAEVRSLTRPLGMAIVDLTPTPGVDHWLNRVLEYLDPILRGFRETMHARAKEHYVARITEEQDGAERHRYITRLDLILKSDPFEPESTATLRLLQTWLTKELPRHSFLGDVQAECYGITATARDLAEVTEKDRRRVNAFVLLAILGILLVLVRNGWLAFYLLVTVLLSYFAALGATVLAGWLWTGMPLTHVDWRVPFFLFTILVAVGEDYNILLVSRALQERKKWGAVEGMRRALAKTGGAITSCGLIMAGTFATLMLAGLNTLMQIGFALAFGVLIDTFVVRPLLVPAFAMLFWRDKKSVEQPETLAVLEMPHQPEQIDQILSDWRKAA